MGCGRAAHASTYRGSKLAKAELRPETTPMLVANVMTTALPGHADASIRSATGKADTQPIMKLTDVLVQENIAIHTAKLQLKVR